MSTGDFVPCMIPQLELFKKKPVQSCITGRILQKLKPLSALPERPDVIEFLCPGRPMHYMDINNICLRLNVTMKKENGNNLDGHNDDVSVIDAPLHSMFSQCEVFLSEVPVTKSPHLYHYKAILDLHTGSDANGRDGLLATSLYIPDEYPASEEGPWGKRMTPFRRSKKVELLGRLRPDVCHMEDGAYILDNVPIRVRLTLNPQEVYLWANAAGETAKMVFNDAELQIPYYVGTPELSLGMEQMLSQQPATYRFKGTQLRTFLHPAQSPNINIPIAVSGKLPTSLLLTVVEASHYNGTLRTNPFHFPHSGLEEISFICNGHERRFVMDGDNPYGCTSMLRSLYTELGLEHEESSGHVYDMNNFTTGKFACAVDLTVDHSGGGPSQTLQEYGTVSIQGRLKAPLPHALCIILYAKYDSVLEINASREVTVL
ncbi:uncharacterized protein LOC117641480 [Thrips palmi]|uniref:Uncharacterized protein LOC117641480 n=1 Tax=Thrips palmi TaxID=161013 RepID=A0A6P8YEA9_THRPL|nr:uncharacterized protein LOC117641480 [Thrips palmi]